MLIRYFTWIHRQDETPHGPKFRLWWAWRPVFLDDGQMVWCCRVARRYYPRGLFLDWDWEYRDPTDQWVKNIGVAQ